MVNQLADINLGFAPLGSVELIEQPIPMMRVQAVYYRNRHTGKLRKKRRIQKLWLKRFGTKTVPAITERSMLQVFVDEHRGRVYAYPPAMKLLLEEMDQRNAQASGKSQISNLIVSASTEEIARYGK